MENRWQQEVFVEFAEALRQAHRRVGALRTDQAVDAAARQELYGRLLVIAETAKHDVARAQQRLARLLAELDIARLPEPSPEKGAN